MYKIILQIQRLTTLYLLLFLAINMSIIIVIIASTIGRLLLLIYLLTWMRIGNYEYLEHWNFLNFVSIINEILASSIRKVNHKFRLLCKF